MIEALLFSIVINLVGFLIAYFLQTDKLTDFAYSFSFTVLVLYGAITNSINDIRWLLVTMVLLWAFRLGGYLVMRIRAIGHDNRFNEMRNSFIKFGGFWALQAVTAWIVLIPVLLAMLSDKTPSNYILLVLGVITASVGLIIEAVADKQKFNFIQDSSNSGKWIQSGLWKYSRHPNYFGEIVMWAGMYIAATPWLEGWQLLISLVSPLFIAGLLLFVSGVPLLEKSADKKWGSQKSYKAYKENTSLLLILPKRR